MSTGFCRGCFYDLAGLGADAAGRVHCPECGHLDEPDPHRPGRNDDLDTLKIIAWGIGQAVLGLLACMALMAVLRIVA